MLLAVMAINQYVIMISLGKYAVYNFINNLLRQSKYCSDLMAKYFNKEFDMNKDHNKGFENYIKYWFCDSDQ